MRRVRTREQASEAGKPKNIQNGASFREFGSDGEPEDGSRVHLSYWIRTHIQNMDTDPGIKWPLNFEKRNSKTVSNFFFTSFF